jgi:hypothetical protein
MNQEFRIELIMAEYHRIYGRFLPDRKLRREILPALESVGLIVLEPDPNDRRQKVVTQALSDSTCAPQPANMWDIGEVKRNVGEVRGTPQPGTLDTITSQCPPHAAHISQTDLNETKETKTT